MGRQATTGLYHQGYDVTTHRVTHITITRLPWTACFIQIGGCVDHRVVPPLCRVRTITLNSPHLTPGTAAQAASGVREGPGGEGVPLPRQPPVSVHFKKQYLSGVQC